MIKTTVHNILVPVLLNDEGANAIKQAMVIHEKFNTKITILYTYPKNNLLYRLFHPMGQIRRKHNAFKELQDFVSDFFGGKIPKFIRFKVKQGTLVNVTVSMISRLHHDLIVLNKKLEPKSGILQSWESGINLIVGEAYCPVLIFNGIPSEQDISQIIVLVEANRRHRHNIAWAVELAKRYNSSIHIVSVLNSNIVLEKTRLHRKIENTKRWIEKRNIPSDVTILRSTSKSIQPFTEYLNHTQNGLSLIMTNQETVLDINDIGKLASEVIHGSEQPVFVITPKKETLVTVLLGFFKSKKKKKKGRESDAGL